MKRNGNDAFWRSLLVTSAVLLCIFGGLSSAGKAYENTLQVGYGIYRSAFQWEDGHLRLFDFEF